MLGGRACEPALKKFSNASGNNLILHLTQWTNFLVSRDVEMLRFFLVHCITTLLFFDHLKFQEFLLNTFQSRNGGVKPVSIKVDV